MEQTDSTILTRPFPPQAVKQRKIGGGMMASYVDGTTVIRRLNEATGNNWSFTVDRHWLEGQLSYALVTLTLPGCGSRQHIGVQSTDSRSGEDAVAKGAITDALKKAATLFGVGLELYGPDYEDDDAPMPRQNAPQPQGQAQQPQRATEHVDRETGEITRPIAAEGQPPTERQIKYLHALAKEKGLQHDDLHDMAIDRYGKSVSELDRRDASAFVDVLKAWQPGAIATPTPIRQDAAPIAAAPENADAWTDFWTYARMNGVSNPKIFTDLTQRKIEEFKNPQNARDLLAHVLASMPQKQGAAGADRYTS